MGINDLCTVIVTRLFYLLPLFCLNSSYGIELELISQTVVCDETLTFAQGSSAKFASTVNGRTHQQSPITSYLGYQYVTFVDAQRRICVGRRELPNGPWEVIQFDDYRFMSNDSHNTSVLGICEKDGTIHLAFDHHATEWNYRVSKLGVARNPAAFQWKADIFSDIAHTLGSVAVNERVTYPRFFSSPNGNLMLYYRAGTSGNGDGMLEEYDGDLHEWQAGLGRFIARYIGTFTFEGETSLYRCPYMNPLEFSGNRLHATWIWRDRFQKTDVRNQHDLCYAYSDDYGRTWRNSDGMPIGTTGVAPMHLDSKGLVVASLPAAFGLSNQNAQFAYPDGSVHVVLRHQVKDRLGSRYHHYWRSSDGAWESEILPFTGKRPKLVGHQDGRMLFLFTDEEQLFVAHGRPNASRTRWKWEQVELPKFQSIFGDALLDLERWKSESVLSVYAQREPVRLIKTQLNEPIDGHPSPLVVLDYKIVEATGDAKAPEIDPESSDNSGALVEDSDPSIQPPQGRLAIVIDGNSPDPDDIGATAVMLGLLKASGLSDRLVYLCHSCDLMPVDRISKSDELRRQAILQEVCEGGVSRFGPFERLSRIYNCRTDLDAAVIDLRDAINASSEDDPLWIVEAGEPDVIGYALQAAEKSQCRFVHVVSHHPANDHSGDYWEWQQILDFRVAEHQIGDQNLGLKTTKERWDWAKENPRFGLRWIWKCLGYAEQDGVVKFQSNWFDCSDAGMVYWWITGADQGGNNKATPIEIRKMLELFQPSST